MMGRSWCGREADRDREHLLHGNPLSDEDSSPGEIAAGEGWREKTSAWSIVLYSVLRLWLP